MPFGRPRSTRSKTSTSTHSRLPSFNSLAPIGAAPATLHRNPSTSSSLLDPFKNFFRQGSKSSRGGSRSVSRASSYAEIDSRASFEASAYQPLTADEARARERHLERSASSYSLGLAITEHKEKQELLRKLDRKECTADEYWETIALHQTARESPVERSRRAAWNKAKAEEVEKEKLRGGYWSPARQNGAEGRTWREAISYDEQKERDEITRLGTFMDVLSIDDLVTDNQMRAHGFKVREHREHPSVWSPLPTRSAELTRCPTLARPVPVMPFSTLSRPPDLLIEVVPSRGLEFDHRPTVGRSRSSSTSSRRREVTPISQPNPRFSVATFDSSPDASSAEPTPATPYEEWVPSSSASIKSVRLVSPVKVDPHEDSADTLDEDADTSRSESCVEERAAVGQSLQEGGQWRRQRREWEESRSRVEADESFYTDMAPSPAKSSYAGYPFSVVDHYEAPSDGALSSMGTPLRALSTTNDGAMRQSSPDSTPDTQRDHPSDLPPTPAPVRVVSYSSHSPVSDRDELSSPSSSVAARYLDRSLSPTALDSGSTQQHFSSNSTFISDGDPFDTSLADGLATIHRATPGPPRATATVIPLSRPVPAATTEAISDPFLDDPAQPSAQGVPPPTPRELYRELSLIVDNPLVDSDYSPMNGPTWTEDASFDSQASPTPYSNLDRNCFPVDGDALPSVPLADDGDASFGTPSSAGGDGDLDSPLHQQQEHRVRSQRAVFGIAMGKKATQLEDKMRAAGRVPTKLVRKGSKPTISSPLTVGSGNLSSPSECPHPFPPTVWKR